jgi:hypothetical protein
MNALGPPGAGVVVLRSPGAGVAVCGAPGEGSRQVRHGS